MTDLDNLRSPDNLHRAWRWIRSNPDARYKSFFRSRYQQFAIAEDELLNSLADRLQRGIYQPQAACKLFFPKPSGILRPYSLLSVEDQIVYQAAVNLIAERLFPRVNHRYFKQIFGHLYAGKTSVWFYRKWSAGYKAFNDEARKAVADGFTFAASFDLTACYDSLDHQVLRHFLCKLGHDPAFCQQFTEWLVTWTATERGVFQNHGIPQGPLSSGLLSEVVLSYFDSLKLGRLKFRYLRYVDDIRLFARNERDLRLLLVELDLLSKDIGLFPQSGKISIHEVTDIEEELKTISNPTEPSVTSGFVDQQQLRKRIVELTPAPEFKIQNGTRFKYLLGRATPSAALTSRLWRVFESHPEIFGNVASYLRRYRKLPEGAAKEAVKYIREAVLYQSVRAELVDAVDGRLPTKHDRVLAKHLRKQWSIRTLHPDLLARLGRFLVRTGQLSPRQIVYICANARSWWTRAFLADELPSNHLTAASQISIAENGIKDSSSDVAIAAAWKLFCLGKLPAGRRRQWNPAGEIVLKEVGMIQRARAGHCGISLSFSKFDSRMPTLNWRRFFGPRYSQAERQAVETVAASGVNITGFVNFLDVFNDWLLDALFRIDGTIGNYKLGSIGSVLGTTSRLATKYPATYVFVSEVHNARYLSMASHPLVKRTGKPTKRISYQFLYKAKHLLRNALAELSAAGIA